MLSPVFIGAIGIVVTQLMKRHKWPIHILACTAMIASMPLYQHISGILDPTLIEGPGPGDHLVVGMWVDVLVVSLILYAAYILGCVVVTLMRHRKSQAHGSARLG
jgi:hypothetical protein